MKTQLSSSTGRLSRKTIEIMLEIKALLRDRGITVKLSTSDLSNKFLELLSIFDDPEAVELRDRLLATIDPDVSRVLQEQAPATQMAPQTAKQAYRENLSTSHHQEREPQIRLGVASNRSPQREDTTRTMPDFSKRATDWEICHPIKKELSPSAAFLGLLQCEQCLGIKTVQVEDERSHLPIEVQCLCQQVYLVVPTQRRFPRRQNQPTGIYLTEDGDKTGKFYIDNFSFQGVLLYTETEHSLQPGEHIHIQFILEDPWPRFVWEQASVEHVYGNSLFVKFEDINHAVATIDKLDQAAALADQQPKQLVALA